MTLFQTITLALVQGLTEFLPVSSSGHLVLFQHLFGLNPPVAFDVLIHLGTLLAVIVYLRTVLKELLIKALKRDREAWKVILLVIIGTLPAVVAGLILDKKIELIFSSLRIVAVCWLINSFLLLSTKFIKMPTRKIKDLTKKDAFFIGIFQAVALLPGISRSGSTMVGALHRKLKDREAFVFSFYLAIPAIFGAFLLKIPDLIHSQLNFSQDLVAMALAGITGYGVLSLLELVLRKRLLWVFAFYTLVLSLLAFSLT